MSSKVGCGFAPGFSIINCTFAPSFRTEWRCFVFTTDLTDPKDLTKKAYKEKVIKKKLTKKISNFEFRIS